MTCFYPLDAWRAQRVNESGKRSIVFNRRDGFMDQHLQVPCGKCAGCSMDKARDWSTRIQNEAALHERNSFLTLTYNDENIPRDGKLNKRHIQDFVRRLRDSGNQLRYFATGEYGGITHRPHYHAIVFGMDFMCPDQEPCGEGIFVNPQLNEIWGKGHVVCAPVTPGACSYVAGYVNKKAGDKDTFNLMSRKPGIGHEWIQKYYKDVQNLGQISDMQGGASKVPKRYLEWKEQELEQVKLDRIKYIQSLTPDQKWDQYRERKAKETHVKQQMLERANKEKVGQSRLIKQGKINANPNSEK